jgi:hypothetical protein
MRLAPRCILIVGLCLPLSAVLCNAQINSTPGLITARITTAIDDNDRMQLRGNVHFLARLAFDRGPVADAQALHRMLLLLRRSSDQESSLLQLLDDQQSKFSPNYQRWLTPDDFGKQFGVTDSDLQTITQWLSSQGFIDIHVGPGRTAVEFSGNVGQVRNTFHTEIHQYEVNGESYLANAIDPQIPAALSAVISGIVSLHNFPVQAHLHQIGTFQKSLQTGEIKPLFTFPGCSSNCYAVGPADFFLFVFVGIVLLLLSAHVRSSSLPSVVVAAPLRPAAEAEEEQRRYLQASSSPCQATKFHKAAPSLPPPP